jgi:valyl-tRNA synthetase
MGWPENTRELATYYPTSVLVTARDIITLWVARMVMMGLYHIGDVPFRDVYIYPTILDGRGVIMSKSKGNGVDPLDIIATYGADGMRATLALMATETQDLRMPVRKTLLPDGREVNTSDRFEIGRNFANKLWNASRFVLLNLEDCPSGPLALTGLTAPDHWVLSCLARTAGLVTQELGGRYGVAAAMGALYRFVWHDFCDWYVELTKARLRAGGDEKHLAQRMLAFVLDQSLRLLHPFIPFLTEAVWQQLNAVLPERALGDRLPAPPASALVIARWPDLAEDFIDPALEAEFALLEEVARAIRRSKRSVGLEERTPLPAVLSCHDQETCRLLESLGPLLVEAAALSDLEVGMALPRPAGSVTQVLERLELFLPVAGLVDLARERAKLEKQLQGCSQQLAAVRQRLTNEEFRRKAPPEVVEREEARAQELLHQSEVLRVNLAGLREA